jgi:hypothetical protein
MGIAINIPIRNQFLPINLRWEINELKLRYDE